MFSIHQGKYFKSLATGFLAAAVVFAASQSQAASPSGKYTFAITSGDTPVGTHVSEFSRQGGDLIVDTTIDAGLKVLFVKVFEYRHRSREVWRNGRLIGFDSDTVDGGKRMFVRARATREGLQVDSTSGSYIAPLGTMVGTMWNPGTLSQNRLIHAESGQLEEVTIAAIGPEPVYGHDGLAIDATRYRLRGSLDMDLWYGGPEKSLAKLRFNIRGHDVEYRPATMVANLQSR